MNFDEIKQLIDLVIEKGLSEFELERNGVRIKIARHAVHPASGPEPGFSAGSAGSSPGVREKAGGVAAELSPHEAADENLYVVRSPMVGTFYASSTPGTEPFVRTGDTVEAGQVLCIIEAMKLMNEIEAEAAGEVVACYVENGQPVEYGEPLFEIRRFGPVK